MKRMILCVRCFCISGRSLPSPRASAQSAEPLPTVWWRDAWCQRVANQRRSHRRRLSRWSPTPRGIVSVSQAVPGTYGVKAELSGFENDNEREDVVSADATARADLRLEVGTLEEGVTVTGRRRCLDTTSALNQTVLDRTILGGAAFEKRPVVDGRAVPSVIMNKCPRRRHRSVRKFVGHRSRGEPRDPKASS